MDGKTLERFRILLDRVIEKKPLTYNEREEYSELCGLWHEQAGGRDRRRHRLIIIVKN